MMTDHRHGDDDDLCYGDIRLPANAALHIDIVLGTRLRIIIRRGRGGGNIIARTTNTTS
jgi:hypothetical protein